MSLDVPATAELPQPPPSVSVIIPARDAEATVGATLDSVLAQDYAGLIEVIVADGSDTPALADLVRRGYPTVRLVPNPEKTTPCGLNAAFRAATGQIIVRCDTWSVLPRGYVGRAVKTLLRTGAATVGARQNPVGTTFFERAVALAMSTPLGAGNARFRIGGPAGPVDTFYLGAFRRDTLEALGGYDATLVRSQDTELNWRIRKRGGTVWFDPELEVVYQPRSTPRKLARQYFDYGRWKGALLRRHPASLLARQAAAPLLVVGLAAAGVLTLVGVPGTLTAIPPLSYGLGLGIGSLAVGLRRREPAAAILPVALLTMHLSWGLGFFLPARRALGPRRA